MDKMDLSYHNTTLMIGLLCLGFGVVVFVIAQHLAQRWKDRNKPKPPDEGFLLDKRPMGPMSLLGAWSIGGLLLGCVLRYVAEFKLHSTQSIMDAVTWPPFAIGAAMGLYYAIKSYWKTDRTFAIILMVVIGMCLYAIVAHMRGA